jgi:uroporphyrinogen decarboxylase
VRLAAWPGEPTWEDLRVPTSSQSAIGGPASSALVRAATGQPVPRPPIWLMRQAGRALPEYRALRASVTMLEACMRPDLVVEITLQPVRRYGVDAAILFSDIVLPLKALGVDLDIVPGVGPVIAAPVATMADVDALPEFDAGAFGFVRTAVTELVAELGSTPLVGFAGAPYTLASYLIEGGPSREHAKTKAMMHGQPEVWNALLTKIASVSGGFLREQVAAGAAAVQLFDSWAGGLAPHDYRRSALPFSAACLASVADLGVPRIHFGVATGEILSDMATAGVEVVGVDWRVPLDRAAERVMPGQALQGNLDPALLLGPWEAVEAAALDIVERGRSAAGHIFNLGHGVLPETDPDQVRRLVDLIHSVAERPAHGR